MNTIRTQLRQQMQLLDELYQPICQRYGLKPSDVDILFALFRGDGISREQLAADLHLSMSFVNTRLRAMENLKLLDVVTFDTPLVYLRQFAEALREEVCSTVMDAESWAIAQDFSIPAVTS